MVELFQAIHTYFSVHTNAASFRILLTGGLWNVEAPPETVFPYGTFQLIMDVPDHFASSKNFVENCLIQFNLFSDKVSGKESLDLLDALTGCFDFENITVSNYKVLSCVRENAIPLKVDNIWQMNVRYRMLLEPGES